MSRGNIGPGERLKRLAFGAASIAAACVWAVYGGAASTAGATILFALFWFGALGFFQAKEKT